MATLADINKTLQSQGSVLEAVADNTNKTGRAIDSFLKSMEISRKKQLEADLENKRTLSQRAADAARSAGEAASGAAQKVRDGITLPPLTAASLAAVPAAFMSTAVRRGIPAALGVTFADEIADYILGPEGSAETKKQLEGAITGGALGSLLGPRFALIGTAIGTLVSDEKIAGELEAMGKNIEDLADKIGIGEAFDDLSLRGVMNSITSTVEEGLGAINDLLTGDFTGFLSDIDDALITLGGLALLISPKLTAKGGKKTMRGLLSAFKKAGPIGKAVGAVAMLMGIDAVFGGDDEIGTDDGIGLKDAAVGAAVVGTGAYTVKKMLTPDQKAAISGTGKYADTMKPYTSKVKTPDPKVVGTLDGKNIVQSSTGSYTYQGADGKATTQVVSEEDLKKMKMANVEYPKGSRLAMLKGLGKAAGPLSLVFAALEAKEGYDIYTNPNISDDEKADKLGSLLFANVGAAGLGAIGAALAATFTSFTGPGAVIAGLAGGAAGGAAGYFAGDYFGGQIMRFLLGGDVDSKLKNKQGAELSTDPYFGYHQMGQAMAETYSNDASITGTTSGRNRARTSKGGPKQTLEPIVDAPAASSADKSIVFGNGNTTITNTAPQALMMNNGGAVDDGSMNMLATSPQ